MGEAGVSPTVHGCDGADDGLQQWACLGARVARRLLRYAKVLSGGCDPAELWVGYVGVGYVGGVRGVG